MLPAIVCALCFAAAPADAPASKEPADLQGAWRLESVEVKGEQRPPLGGGQPLVVIDGAKVIYDGEEVASLTADARSTPKIIDVTFPDPKRTMEGIYAVEKDTLKICLNIHTDGVKERPGDFSTADKENPRVLVFQREKADSADKAAGLAGFLGLMLGFDPDQNEVLIKGLIPKTAAAKADLKEGDVVLQVGDVKPTTLKEAVDAVRGRKPGSEIILRVRRDGKEQEVKAKVGVMPFELAANLLS